MMSVRDGVFSRYAVDDELELEDEEAITVIGAPPLVVTTGLPGATGVTLAFVDRVDRAADRQSAAFDEWLREKWEDVAPDEQKPPTADERAFLADWPPWFARWKSFVVSVQPAWDPFGPTPVEVWQKTEAYETEVETFRTRFAALVKGLHVKPPPEPPTQSDGSKGYEEPGGVKQPGLLDDLGVSSALGTIGTIVLVGAGALVVFAVVNR